VGLGGGRGGKRAVVVVVVESEAIEGFSFVWSKRDYVYKKEVNPIFLHKKSEQNQWLKSLTLIKKITIFAFTFLYICSFDPLYFRKYVLFFREICSFGPLSLQKAMILALCFGAHDVSPKRIFKCMRFLFY